MCFDNYCILCGKTIRNQVTTVFQVKEWLCLNCQMKRAIGASEPPGPPPFKSQTSPSKVPPAAAVQLNDSSKPATPLKKEISNLAAQKTETSEPVSPQRKPSTSSVQSSKSEATIPPVKQGSPAPDHKTVQEKQKTAPEKQPDQANQPGRKASNATAATQQESGGFFGFGGPKSQPDATKAAEAVGGKMLGFGSSIFSSASTLITSVREQTPPVSPKMSPAKDSRSPTVKKVEQENKPEQPQQDKGPKPVQPKADDTKAPAPQQPEQQKKTEPSLQTKTPPLVKAKAPPESPKVTEPSQTTVKPDQSTCPLCKVELNRGSKEPPNYNTCTECKNTVCNQCGFNPMPNETTVSFEKKTLCITYYFHCCHHICLLFLWNTSFSGC